MTRRRRATDHRALVLEVIATTPRAATRDAVTTEVIAEGGGDFRYGPVSAMVSALLGGGFIGTRYDGTLFVTRTGLDYLACAAFDRALPQPHVKPNRRRKSPAITSS